MSFEEKTEPAWGSSLRRRSPSPAELRFAVKSEYGSSKPVPLAGMNPYQSERLDPNFDVASQKPHLHVNCWICVESLIGCGRLLDLILMTLSSLLSGLRGQAALQAENIALRHQVTVLQRTHTKRPVLKPGDRCLWVWLSLCMGWMAFCPN